MLDKIKYLLSQTDLKNWLNLNKALGKRQGYAQSNIRRAGEKLNRILKPAGLKIDVVKIKED